MGRDVEREVVDEYDGLSREELIAVIRKLTGRVAYLEKENEALRRQLRGVGPGNALPPFVKPNRKKESDSGKARKKRRKWFVRRLETPTEEIEHYVGERCPDCGGRLSRPWEHTTRQVIEIPESPIRIIDHVIMAQRCGYCGKVHYGKLTPADGVLGKHRFGIRLISLVTTLSVSGRIPHRMIQRLLKALYGVHISVGEISELLHEVARRGKREVESILEAVRGSPVVHADETGWREDGVNGYLWSLSTPSVRYFHRDASRGADVPKSLLGESFEGVLVSDFYYAYNWYLGPKQRCWAHLADDLAKLVEDHAEDARVAAWAQSVLDLYKAAKKASRRELSEKRRWELASAFERELYEIGRPFMEDESAPQHTLATRIARFEGEFFTFVRYKDVPPTNNAAERALRPAVIARKVSGGTRSRKGSETKSILMTLFGTWALRKGDPLQSCAQMLVQSAPSPSAA